MILVWGPRRDTPVRAVRRALAARGAPVLFLDQRRVLEAEVELRVGARLTGRVRCAGVELELDRVTAAYLRPYSGWRVPAVIAAGAEAERHAATADHLLMTWATLTPALVVNPPTAGESNSSKPAHAAEIARHGFATPPTLVTTDLVAARAFLAQHGDVIYKSISGVRSIVTEFTETDIRRLEEGMACPVQLQARVGGTDVRVHVAGDATFACEIVSAASDYRYAGRGGHTVELRPIDLPADVAGRCRDLAGALGLVMSGIDLRRDADGTWWCFEVNPSPAFTYYDDEPREPIANALADLLAGAVPAAETVA